VIRTRDLIESCTAAVAIVLTAPLICAVATVTLLSLGRPVLFRQKRGGLGGKSFEMMKFRTMRDLRDSEGAALPDEARLSFLGRLMRRTRLDELPELWHIVRRDMSWVGPRPLLPETIQGFGALGEKRGAVRPGLTGWAQINGNTLLKADEKLLLDLWYVDNRSARLDLKIMLRTIRVIITGERVNQASLERAVARGHRRSG
jgi:lipopolysaccharide/colanic/teichoic acid biosynthesis glycosyltransferase